MHVKYSGKKQKSQNKQMRYTPPKNLRNHTPDMHNKIAISFLILTFSHYAYTTKPQNNARNVSWSSDLVEIVEFKQNTPSTDCKKQASPHLKLALPSLAPIKPETMTQTPDHVLHNTPTPRVIATRHSHQQHTPQSIRSIHNWFNALAGTSTLGIIFLIARYLRQ